MTEENVQESEQTDEEAEEDDLDALLADYDKEEEPAEEEKPEEPSELDQVKSELEELKQYQQTAQQRDEKAAIQNSVSALRESADGKLDHLSDKFLEARLRLQANEDPRLVKAFYEREKDPAKFERILKSFGKQVAGEVNLPDGQLTKDREAMHSYVRSQSQKSGDDEKPDVRLMSGPEFEKYVNEQMAAEKRQRLGI